MPVTEPFLSQLHVAFCAFYHHVIQCMLSTQGNDAKHGAQLIPSASLISMLLVIIKI